MTLGIVNCKCICKISLAVVAFALLLQPAFASLHEVQVTKLYKLEGCYDVNGVQITSIKPGEKISCHKDIRYEDSTYYVYLHLIDETQFRVSPGTGIDYFKAEVIYKAADGSEASEAGEAHKIRRYNTILMTYLTPQRGASHFLWMRVLEDIKVTDQHAVASAEKLVARTGGLPREQILVTEARLESEFGPGTILRWDAYINPNANIPCLSSIASEKMQDPTPFIIYRNPDNEKVKKVLSSLYYASDSASRNKFGVKVSPLLVYTIGMGEGLINALKNYYCTDTYNWFIISISGFSILGMDHFSDEAVVLKSGGFLRQDFDEGDEYQPVGAVNEKREAVKTAYFANLHYGLEALAARVAWAKYLFERDAKALGIDLKSFSEDEINYWTYYYFNTGAGTAKAFLKNKISTGTLHDTYVITAKLGEKVRNGLCGRHNAIIRTATASFISRLGIFV